MRDATSAGTLFPPQVTTLLSKVSENESSNGPALSAEQLAALKEQVNAQGNAVKEAKAAAAADKGNAALQEQSKAQVAKLLSLKKEVDEAEKA